MFGNYDHGTNSRKRSRSILVDIERGGGGKAYYSYSDDNNGVFKNPIEINIGGDGDRLMNYVIRRGGGYKRRRHRLIHSDDSKFIFNGFYEDVSIRGRD